MKCSKLYGIPPVSICVRSVHLRFYNITFIASSMDSPVENGRLFRPKKQRMSGGQFPQQGRQKKSPNMIASPLIFGPSIPQFHSHPFWSSTAISETSRSGRPHSGIVLRLTKKGYQPWGMPRPETLERKARRCKEVSKEVVGIHVLLTRSIFACDILRRLLRRVSPVQSTSAPLRC